MISLSFSGGADSLYLYHYCIDNNIPFDNVVCFSCFDFLDVEDAISLVSNDCLARGIEFINIQYPYDALVDLFRKYGYCSTENGRVLTTEKIRLIHAYVPGSVQILGFTDEERFRAKNFSENIYPLIGAATHKYCIAQCYSLGYYPRRVYDYVSRTGCPFCLFKSDFDLYRMKIYLPDDYLRLCQLEKDVGFPIRQRFLDYYFDHFAFDEDFVKLASVPLM